MNRQLSYEEKGDNNSDCCQKLLPGNNYHGASATDDRITNCVALTTSSILGQRLHALAGVIAAAALATV